jgi:hypothetical protein
LGTLAAGWIFSEVMSDTSAAPLQQWQWFWLFPLLFAVVVMVLFGFGFREKAPAQGVAVH